MPPTTPVRLMTKMPNGNALDVSATNPLPVYATFGGAPALLQTSATCALNGDNTILAAPGAGNRYVICSFQMQNEGANPMVMILQTPAPVQLWRVLGQNQGDGAIVTFAAGRELRLPENAGLEINLSAAQTCNYSIVYYTEAV